MQRWITLAVLTSALTGLTGLTGAAAPAWADDEPAATSVTLGEAARIDPNAAGRVRVEVGYVCTNTEEARSLTVSVEQKNPEDATATAFGSSRTAETDIVCDGTPQTREVIVQSKTYNWLPDIDAIVTSTISDIGATPPAAADAKRVTLVAAE
ncbi:hypothetical protein [Kitasatospora brasiliensis]|uniref:hypothetical protein n=1 Tax=Kitasatospora brasiliensis TaxID=3058040 RepID=UPI00293089B0|nr:hypothetical protein [Kitasatospora sp. K002]